MGRTALFSRHQPGGVFTIDDIQEHPGEIFFVGSAVSGATDGAGYGKNPDAPFATLNYAVGQCTANRGDVIYVLPGHTETLTAAGAIALNVAGISVIGLGKGALRPTFTFTTSTAATITITANNVTVRNLVTVCNVNLQVTVWNISGTDCDLDVEHQDTDATHEALRAVLTTAAADRLRIKLRYIGFTAGTNCVNSIRLVGADHARIEVDFFGKLTTAVVEFVTTACTDVQVRGRTYVSGTTDGSKNVVDTIGGSNWDASVFDGAAAAWYSGGSGAAIASDDVSSIYSRIGAPAGASIAADIAALPTTTAPGTIFAVKKTLTSSAITQAGVDITLVSTGGDLEILEIHLNTDGTGLATGTNFQIVNNNAKGATLMVAETVANLGASKTVQGSAASATKLGGATGTQGVVLESGKKLTAKSTVADCTGAGTMDVYLICRRLAAGASLAAA